MPHTRRLAAIVLSIALVLLAIGTITSVGGDDRPTASPSAPGASGPAATATTPTGTPGAGSVPADVYIDTTPATSTAPSSPTVPAAMVDSFLTEAADQLVAMAAGRGFTASETPTARELATLATTWNRWDMYPVTAEVLGRAVQLRADGHDRCVVVPFLPGVPPRHIVAAACQD